MQNKKFSTRYLTKVAMLTAIAVVLMYLEFPLPLFPAFLKMDLSDIPALIGGFALGPIAGIIIEFVKNLIHFIIKNDATGGVGNLANFIVGVALIVPASIIYIKYKTRKSAIIGMLVGLVAMVVVAVLANYFILLPLYGMSNLEEVKTFVIATTIPFNALKGAIVCIITGFIYKPLSRILHK